MEERREARRAVMAAREMESTLRVKLSSVDSSLSTNLPMDTHAAPNTKYQPYSQQYSYPGDENSSSSLGGTFRPAGSRAGRFGTTRGGLGVLEEVDDYGGSANTVRGADDLVRNPLFDLHEY